MSQVRNSAGTMPLHIVFVAPFGLKHKATVWARTLPIARSLTAAGHNTCILVPPWDSPEDAGRIETLHGVRVEQLSLAGGLPGTLRRMLRAIDQAQPEIVHIVKPRAHAGLVQWWLWQRRAAQSRLAPPKIVLDVDDWEQAWNPINRYNWLVRRFLTWQEEWGIRHADGITTASRWLEATIAEVAPQIPTFYLPNGVDPSPVAPLKERTVPDDAPKVLYFTRFVEVTPTWLSAFWDALHNQIPAAELVIAGTPVQPWLAEPFRAAMARKPQVRWTGYVPPAEVRQLYAHATCAIFPAMPIPLLQAKCSVRLATTLLHGVPVVASAVGEHVHYGAEGAARLISPDATPEQFAGAVADLIRNPSDNEILYQQATERLLTRYAWSRLVEPLPAFYNSLL